MISIDVKKKFPAAEMAFTFELTSNRTIIFGPSGSGKSSLLKLMTGFNTPDHGKIVVGNSVIFDKTLGVNLPIHLRQFGYLPQDYTLFPHLTVKDNILYGLRSRNFPYIAKEFKQIVERLGVAEHLFASPAQLSGGQQQRVALARIMLIQPKALLLDEPFSALDSATRESLRELVLELTDDTDIPALLVTHDLDEALIFGREIVIVKEGRVLEYGNKEDIFYAPRYTESAKLLGFQVWPLIKQNGSQLITTDGETFYFRDRGVKDAKHICIRPEDIMLIRQDRPLPKGRSNVVDGSVLSINHRARYVRLVFRSALGHEFIIHTPEHVIQVMNIYKGKQLQISLKSKSLIVCR